MRRLSRRRQTRKKKSRYRSKRIQRGSGNNLEIQYSTGKVAGQIIPVEQTQQKPNVSIPDGHYLVMYDPDAGNPDWIHWISSKDDDILPYQGPAPPTGTGIHRYIFILVAGNPPSAPLERGGQNAETLAPHGQRVATVSFLAGKN
jgi:hypothetical protein